MRKRLLALIIALSFFVMAVVWCRFILTPVVTDGRGYKYTVHPAQSMKSVINDLYFKNIIKNRFFFTLLVYSYPHGRSLKAGEYLFPSGTTPYRLLKQIVTGSGLAYYQFTIIPGWTMRQLRAAILKEPHLRHTIQEMSDAVLMHQLQESASQPEGQFYPDTYYFAENTTDFVLLKRAFKAMQQKLRVIWQGRAIGLPFKDINEVLIVASMIEKETEFDMERPIIAGVIINRLRKNMLLQIDPTVVYGLGTRFNGTIYKKNLLENTPYNTYVHKGLPPTPIAIPSNESMVAVVHPQNHAYLYFVARHGIDSAHQFSKTLAEHYAAVAASKKKNTEFFNYTLMRYYLLKLFSDRMMWFPLTQSE